MVSIVQADPSSGLARPVADTYISRAFADFSHILFLTLFFSTSSETNNVIFDSRRITCAMLSQKKRNYSMNPAHVGPQRLGAQEIEAVGEVHIHKTDG